MKTFVESREAKGRRIASKFLTDEGAQDIKSSESNYTCYDLSYLLNGEICVAEIKVRDYKHDAFNTWILEKEKYDMLRDLTSVFKLAGRNLTVHYINIFTDGVILVWDITEVNIPSETKELIKTSSDVFNGVRDKKVILLPTKDAERYNYTDRDDTPVTQEEELKTSPVSYMGYIPEFEFEL